MNQPTAPEHDDRILYTPYAVMPLVDGNAYDALLLAKILNWQSQNTTGQPNLNYDFNETTWIVFSTEEWLQHLGFTSTYKLRQAFNRLIARGLLIKERHRSRLHDMNPVNFIRLDEESFAAMGQGRNSDRGANGFGSSGK